VHVIELWRHPVKSLQGEPLDEAVVEESGMHGDRKWGIVDCATGVVLTGRRVPSLLLARARLTDTGVEITLPDGEVIAAPSEEANDALSTWIGRAVELVHADSFGAGVGEFFADATDDNSAVVQWTMPPGRFVDAGQLLLVTTASLRQGQVLHPDGVWETRRFRPGELRPWRRGTITRAACAPATKAARTPASIMLCHRCVGCCQNGRPHVNSPFSTICSYPPQTEFTKMSRPPASSETRSKASEVSSSRE